MKRWRKASVQGQSAHLARRRFPAPVDILRLCPVRSRVQLKLRIPKSRLEIEVLKEILVLKRYDAIPVQPRALEELAFEAASPVREGPAEASARMPPQRAERARAEALSWMP